MSADKHMPEWWFDEEEYIWRKHIPNGRVEGLVEERRGDATDKEMVLLSSAPDLLAENQRLKEVVKMQTEALNEVQWVAHPDGYPDVCPWCYANSNKVHEKDCKRQNAIFAGESVLQK